MKKFFVDTRAGEPEPRAMEPANFGGAGAGARVTNCVEPEPSKFLLAPAPNNILFSFKSSINSWI